MFLRLKCNQPKQVITREYNCSRVRVRSRPLTRSSRTLAQDSALWQVAACCERSSIRPLPAHLGGRPCVFPPLGPRPPDKLPFQMPPKASGYLGTTEPVGFGSNLLPWVHQRIHVLLPTLCKRLVAASILSTLPENASLANARAAFIASSDPAAAAIRVNDLLAPHEWSSSGQHARSQKASSTLLKRAKSGTGPCSPRLASSTSSWVTSGTAS